MYKTLVFLDGSPKRIIGKLAEPDLENILFLTANEKTYLQLQEMSCRTYFAQDILTADDIVAVNQTCLDFVRSIFSPEAEDPFQYEGLPCGDIAEYFLIPYFMRVYRDIICTVKLLNHFPYREVVVAGTDRFTETVRTVLQQTGIAYRSFFHRSPHKIAYLAGRYAEGKKNLWAGTPLRDILVEAIQNVVIIGSSYIKRLFSISVRRENAAGQGKKCLIFSADRYTYEIFRALKKSAEWDFLTCGMFYQFRKTQLRGVASLEGAFNLGMLMKGAKASMHFLFTWSRLCRDASFRNKFRFQGIDYWGRIRGIIKYTLLISFPRLFLDYLIAAEAFRSHPRAVCIVSDDHVPYYKNIVYAARQCGTKSIVIQHGILAGINVSNSINADFYAAWGPRAIDWFSRNWDASAGDKIFITGSPRYDEYRKRSGFDGERILKTLRLPADKKYIVIFLTSAWSGDFSIVSMHMRDLFMIDAVMHALNKLGTDKNCQVVIKPHPGGDIDLLRQFLKAKEPFPPNVTIVEGHLEELFFVADICISAYSSCILEAMFFEKPSIVFDHLRVRESVPYVSRGAALGASNQDEMAASIRSLLFDKEARKRVIDAQKKYIEYELLAIDGNSTERVVSLIERIISEGK